MKNKKKWYAFSEEELQILKELASGIQELPELEQKLRIKPNLISYHLRKLERKGLIKVKPISYWSQKSEARKIAVFTNLKHATILKTFLKENHFSIEWEKALSGFGIEVLFNATAYPNQPRSVSYPTFWRYCKKLNDIGIITLNDLGYYKINDHLLTFQGFIKEYQAYIAAEETLENLSGNPQILWQKGPEFLIKVPKGTVITQKGFEKTGTLVLSKYGNVDFEDFDFYFYPKIVKKLSVEETILHILLEEKGNTKYSTYSYLLLNQELSFLDEKLLLEKAEWYDLSRQVNNLLKIAKFRRHS